MSDRRNFLKATTLLSLGSPLHVAAYTQSRGAETQNTHIPLTPPVQPRPEDLPHPLQFTLGSPARFTLDSSTTQQPLSWIETKAQLRAGLNSLDPKDPVHKWLQVFLETTFDRRAAQAVVDASTLTAKPDTPDAAHLLRYEPQLYESTLRSAASQLDRCLAYRNEAGSFEVAGVSAGIAYLTFLRVRSAQQTMIAASNTADLSDIERQTAVRSATIYARAETSNDLYPVDSIEIAGLRSDADGARVGADQAAKKSDQINALLQEQFGVEAHAQLMRFTRLLTPGSSANYAERYLRLMLLVEQDLTDAYLKLYSVSKGVQQVLQFTTLPIRSNPVASIDISKLDNLAEVLSFIQRMAPPKDDVREPDILDALVYWCRLIMRELDRLSQYETEITVSVPLTQPYGPTPALIPDLPAALAAGSGKITFSLSIDSIPFAARLRAMRVVGIGLSVEHDSNDAVPLPYTDGFPKDSG